MIEEIKKIIEEKLGVLCTHCTPHSPLGEEGVGLDSQEIVEFTCLMQSLVSSSLPPICFSKRSTLQEIAKKLENLRTPSFDGSLETSVEIKCDAKESYQAIYDLERWPERLPHVKRIELLYNDGIYQEFLMDVQSQSGMVCVRSIRRCDPQEGILFFQPKPPAFLRHHSGGWSFTPTSSGCSMKTWHRWNLQPSTDDQRIRHVLQEHAELALTTWKNFLETRHAH